MSKTRYAYSRALDKQIPVGNALPPEMLARQERERQKRLRKYARKGEAKTFARIPHEVVKLHGKLSAAAFIVLIELDWLIFQGYGRNPVHLTGARFVALGMHRTTKYRALRQLEAVGAITILKRGRESTLITYHWYPDKA